MVTDYRCPRPARIVLAEDNRTIARLIEVALQRTGVPHELNIVHDGDQAIAALEKKSSCLDDIPDLFLLDLHMPGKNGFEVLEYIKQQEQLRRIPVVMFSSSSLPADVNRAYDLHANAYVRKNPNLPELSRTLDSVLRFWLN
jgi:two-component system, chemotaxis family, response regulator Rcp1